MADRVPVLVVVVGKGPSRGKKRSDGARGEEPERPAAADGAFSQSSSQLVEGAVGSLLAHPLPPIPKDGTNGSPAPLINEGKYEGLQGWRNFAEYLFHALR